MKINNLQINGFGKLCNKELEFDKNINIVYGKNEAGKSTLLAFINSIFYGVNKNKNGKDISDFDKYTPWKKEEFSGKISYELDNSENYEIFRNFKSKNPVIYNSNKQDISLNYPIDKNKGIDFLYNQINIDETTFKNTVIIAQNDIKINKSAQTEMVQKISNIVSSGDENISYRKTLDKINKLQIENVGTERTKGKPINLINDKIEKLKSFKNKIETYKDGLKESNIQIENIKNKIEIEEIKLSLYKLIKENNERKKVKNSEIEVVRKIRDEYLDKIEDLDNKFDRNSKEKVKNEKKSSILEISLIMMFIIVSVICFVLNINKLIPIILLSSAFIVFLIDIILRIKFNKNKKLKIEEIENLENRINQEINILRDNIKSRQFEIDIKQDEIKETENEVNRLVMNEFEAKLSSDFIEEAFELEDVELNNKIAFVNETLNNLKIEKGAKENQRELMLIEIDDLSKVQEELNNLEGEKLELLSLDNSYNLAKEGLEKAYENIRNSLSPKFINKLCNIVSKISNGKYQEINFVDIDGLIVEIEDGRFFPVERLSQGTIDQMYLSLRLASIDAISNEKMPIILDETFAFFDDDRLKNMLNFLNENYKDNQIIIFTCSRREIEVLKKLNVDYNYIELEN